ARATPEVVRSARLRLPLRGTPGPSSPIPQSTGSSAPASRASENQKIRCPSAFPEIARGRFGAAREALRTPCAAPARSKNQIRRHREMIEIPLHHAGFALAAAQREFHVRRVALAPLRRDAVGKKRAQQLERGFLVANADEVHLPFRLERRARLQGSEFTAEEIERFGQRHP